MAALDDPRVNLDETLNRYIRNCISINRSNAESGQNGE